jgi:hypothetical protein
VGHESAGLARGGAALIGARSARSGLEIGPRTGIAAKAVRVAYRSEGAKMPPKKPKLPATPFPPGHCSQDTGCYQSIPEAICIPGEYNFDFDSFDCPRVIKTTPGR